MTRLATMAVALVVVWPFAATWSGHPALTALGTQIAIYGVAAVGGFLVLGLGGLVSLGQAGFFGLGGYTAGIVAANMDAGLAVLGWAGSSSALVIWPLAAAVAGLGGLLIGAISLRVSGVQFIMLTWAFGQLIHLLLVSLAPYGGDDGLLVQHRTEWPVVGAPSDLALYAICWVVLGLILLCCRRVVAAPFGAVVSGLRQNERRVSSLGIRPFPLRLATFALSAACLGLAGAMWADFSGFVSPDMAGWPMSGEFLAMAILGGVGTAQGAVLGAVAYNLLQAACTTVTERWSLVFGVALVVIVLTTRGGLYGVLRRVAARC